MEETRTRGDERRKKIDKDRQKAGARCEAADGNFGCRAESVLTSSELSKHTRSLGLAFCQPASPPRYPPLRYSADPRQSPRVVQQVKGRGEREETALEARRKPSHFFHLDGTRSDRASLGRQE